MTDPITQEQWEIIIVRWRRQFSSLHEGPGLVAEVARRRIVCAKTFRRQYDDIITAIGQLAPETSRNDLHVWV